VAGANAEGVIAGYPWDPDRRDPKFLAFRERFKQRFGDEPETYAAHGYDGMNMLIQATQEAGLNRAKIRDVLAYQTKPFQGVTGDILFSGTLDDIGEVFLARFEKGQWRYYSREQLQVPKPNLPRRTPEGVGLSTPKPS
jgi:ABC-type branched-subunit amino acid transport system substrate-binding protein